MLNIKAVSVNIKNVAILQRVNLDVATGHMVGLIGRNGAGKTTLIRAIMGLIPAYHGEIIFEGKDLLKTKAHDRARKSIGYLPEDRRLIPHFTIEENIAVPLWSTKSDDGGDTLHKIYQLIPEIARFKNRQAISLSGGQQKLVALARALACGSKLLLLDEPFEGVAPALAGRLIEVIARLKHQGISVLIAESDDSHSKYLVDKTYIIERGHIKAP